MEKYTSKYKYILYESLENQLKSKLNNEYISLKNGILNLIEKTIKNDNLNEAKKFINEYIQNPVIEKIEGFNNISELYNFYLKFQNDIDEICLKNNFYRQNPEELNIKSLYDYIIEGSKSAILNIFKKIQSETEKTT
jgi:hypothetical protein